MWVLLIFTLYSTGHAAGSGTTTVPGFSSKETCEKAGYEFVSKASDMKYYFSVQESKASDMKYYFSVQEKQCLFGCNDVGTYTLSYHSDRLQYAYSCMEVK